MALFNYTEKTMFNNNKSDKQYLYFVLAGKYFNLVENVLEEITK